MKMVGDRGSERDERAAAAAQWIVVRACHRKGLDPTRAAELALQALDSIDPNDRLLTRYRSDPANFSADFLADCADLVDAIEACSDAEIKKYVVEGYQRADAVPQQSAEIVLALGAAAALIIVAIRFKVLVIGKNWITVSAYKTDKHTTETLREAGTLLTGLFGSLASKQQAVDTSEPDPL